MKIEYDNGDLMQAPELFSIQGCNAQGAMGSGVAKLWRDHDENVFTTYRKVYEESGLKLGQVVPVATRHPTRANEEVILFNAITQEFYGGDKSIRYASYDGIDRAITEINDQMVVIAGIMAANGNAIGLPRVSLPLIGAGLANGRWPIIAAIIEANSFDFQPVVYLRGASIPG